MPVAQYNVVDYGLVGDGATPNDEAWAALWQTINGATPTGSLGNEIFWPVGRYRFSRRIDIDRCVRLQGVGARGFFGSSVLQFDDGSDGLVFHRQTSSTSGGGSDNSELDSLYIRARNGGSQTQGVGIRCHARIQARNVMVRYFGGYGVWIGAGTEGTFGPYPAGTNANFGHWQDVDVWQCKSHGIVVDGNDANVNMFQNVSSVGNKGWGFYDTSGLGNNYLGCHTESNTAGPYYAPGDAQSGSFIACYSEGGQGQGSTIKGSNLVLGGNHGAGFTPDSTAPQLSGATSGKVKSTKAVEARNDLGAMVITASLSDHTPGRSAFTFGASDESAPREWRLQRDVGGWSGWWFWSKGNGAVLSSGMATDKNTQGLPVGLPVFPQGFALAQGAGAVRRQTLGVAAPTAGAYSRGDIVWNRTPDAGGYVGWICTTTGTPGTWKPFGAIAA